MGKPKEVQTIIIVNGGQIEVDENLFSACLAKVGGQIVNSSSSYATITIQARKPNGWLEYGIAIEYDNSPSYFIGALQRTEGAEIEFHS